MFGKTRRDKINRNSYGYVVPMRSEMRCLCFLFYVSENFLSIVIFIRKEVMTLTIELHKVLKFLPMILPLWYFLIANF